MNGMRTVFGWTLEEIAHAKQRHFRMTGVLLTPDVNGIAKLQHWWQGQAWPDPLSTTFAGVSPESDIGWAADAVCAVMRDCGRYV